MRAHPLPEARAYADLMLTELRKVVPSFLKRVDLPERGVRTSAYMDDTRASVEALSEQIFGDEIGGPVADDVVEEVSSLYHLAQIHRSRGDDAKAEKLLDQARQFGQTSVS